MSAGTEPLVQIVEARVHGRVLVQRPSTPRPWPTLVGFHGYAEDAGIHLQALGGIAGLNRWLVVSVQALHPFYTRQQRIVANWMTSQDREVAIADNVDYVGRVLDSLRGLYGEPRSLVFAGFSQGGAMAYRAAARYASAGVIVLAADVPPDVGAAGTTLPPVLLGRGTADPWYTAEKHDADMETLSRLGVTVEPCVFEGGHEWGTPFYAAASRFLSAIANHES